MKKGDLVMSKDKSVVGVVIEFSYMMRNVTIAVVWNDPPSAQGCKYFTLHNDNVILVPQGTVFKTKTKECEYMRYDSVTGIIHGVGEYISVVDNVITDVIFKDDIETKNNSQYTCLGIEPWEIMDKNFTREEFIGFCKCCILKYILRKKGTDLQDAEKIEHYARKLQELLKHETI